MNLLLKGMAKLPLGVLYSLAWVSYLLLYHILRYRRPLVLENLGRAFPHKTSRELRALARHFYRIFCDFAVEVIKTPGMTGEDLEQHVDLVNADLLQPFIDAGQPILLAGAHQANWEWALLVCARQLPLPLESIYKPLGHSAADSFLQRVRNRFGVTLLPAEEAVTRIIKQRRSLRATTLIADQNPERKEERYWTDFFGRETPFALGCEKLARMTRFPVVFTHVIRVDRGRYQVRFSLLAEPPYTKNSNTVLERYVRQLESSITQQPENWLWTYARWRHKKPLYARD